MPKRCDYAVKRVSLTHNEHNYKYLDRHSDSDNYAELYVERQHHYDTADEEDTVAHQHSQHEVYHLLKGGDVGGKAGDERAGGEFIGLLKRKTHYLFKDIAAQVAREALRSHAAQCGRAYSASAADDYQQHHEQACVDYQPHILPEHALVNYFRHQLWLKQVYHYLADHSQRGEQREQHIRL